MHSGPLHFLPFVDIGVVASCGPPAPDNQTSQDEARPHTTGVSSGKKVRTGSVMASASPGGTHGVSMTCANGP